MIKHRNEKGELHRLDGPAVENDNGEFVWYKDGKIHREQGPAVRVILTDGTVVEQYWAEGMEIA